MRRSIVLGVALTGACGPGAASEDTGAAMTTSATGGSPATGDTGDEPTGGDTVHDDATGDPTGGSFAGVCGAGWEHPASAIVQIEATVPDATVDDTFDPQAVYPDGTSPVCVRWQDEKIAGVRLAFGPVAGDGPESLLEIVVDDGEREYNNPQWPPPPGAYDGVAARYTVHIPPDAPEIFDFEADQGIGFVNVSAIPKAPGEHLRIDAKLSIPADQGAEIVLTFDAVVGVVMDPTVDFCETLDSQTDCELAECGGWFETFTIDPATCSFTPVGYCAAEVASTGDVDHDGAFFKTLDGVVRVARVGVEGKEWYGDEHPAGWTECTGAPGDPPECDCVCAVGVCPGDVALALMNACDLPTPCPDGLPFGEADECIFGTVAADEPAALRVHVSLGDPEFDDNVFLRGDGTATWLHGECDNISFSCGDMDFGVPRTCTLREPAFFTECATTMSAQCHDFTQWFTSCTVEPATCP